MKKDSEIVSSLDFIQPQDIDAEQSVLSSLLVYPEDMEKTDGLLPEDFYRTSHCKIFAAILELYKSGTDIDLITVVDYLRKKNQLEEIGGATFLSSLINDIPGSSSVSAHVGIIKEKSRLRHLIQISNNIAKICFDGSENAESIINGMSRSVSDIQFGNNGNEAVFISEVVEKTLDHLEELSSNKTVQSGLLTGFYQLDDMLGGLQDSDLVIVSGRPSMGKTALALDFIKNFAKNGHMGVYFSMEMSKLQNAIRVLASESRIDTNLFKSAHFTMDQWRMLTDAATNIYNWPLLIDDSSGLSYMQVCSRARKLHKEHKIKYMVVDYLSLMKGDSRSQNRNLELSTITKAMKGIAKDLSIPVVLLSQLNRKVEERTNKRPMLSDLRESGAIEEDADVVMGVYRDEYYNKDDTNPLRGIAEILILKHRNGPVGTAELMFNGSLSSFCNLAHEY